MVSMLGTTAAATACQFANKHRMSAGNLGIDHYSACYHTSACMMLSHLHLCCVATIAITGERAVRSTDNNRPQSRAAASRAYT
jgi:hypothetical protein